MVYRIHLKFLKRNFFCELLLNDMKNLIEELKWRGLIQDIMPGTEEQLLKEPTAGYVGFDPTADSLHIGGLIPIIILVHLQKFGHKPVAWLAAQREWWATLQEKARNEIY